MANTSFSPTIQRYYRVEGCQLYRKYYSRSEKEEKEHRRSEVRRWAATSQGGRGKKGNKKKTREERGGNPNIFAAEVVIVLERMITGCWGWVGMGWAR